ncbi:MAG: SUMF1/EgtB/PvdO family nonheme iron enzyme [Myxococcaceae bacterium]
MRRALVMSVCVLMACGPDDSRVDAGVSSPDGSVVEPDAGSAVVDAGADGGVVEPDAGRLDAGQSQDAGVKDAGGGPVDAGVRDAGVIVTCTAGGIPGTCLDVSECRDTRQPTAGLCPGAANIQCCTPRYTNACDPNARPRPNEGLTEAAGTGGCPAGMVRVSTFCIDRYEAFLEEADGGTWCPFVNPGSRPMRARSVEGAVPQGFINQVQASAACVAAGKRLCTDTEWLRACRGPTSTTYPYGNTRVTGVCNDRRSVHPAIELYGTGASWVYSHIDSPCLNQLDGGLARSGDFSGCASAEGVFDLMGNLHEWTADPAGTFRGGFYVDTVINGNGCLYATTAHDVSHWDYSTGFRCCQ